MLVALVAAAVGVAFADSSIVVLALPALYGQLHTSIEGVAWVVTAYNASVAVAAFVLVFFVHRLRGPRVLGVGLVVFLVASIACASADTLAFLVGARCVQGAGAALLLAGSLPVLVALTGSAARGAAVWTLAGTLGASLGPALGGALTQAFDWRSIFIVQAPIAGLGLIAAVKVRSAPAALEEGWRPSLRRRLPANICIGLLFGALVGVLFLAVLLVITVWGYSPIGGALIVSVLPAATLAARPLARRLDPLYAVCGGAALLALGLVGLAALPSSNIAFAMVALGICGIGLGLAVPILSDAALDTGSGPDAGLARSGTFTIGVRHLGLVLALVLIAPLLASTLPDAGDRATLEAANVLLDAPIGLTQKVPIAIDIGEAFDRAQDGDIPDLAEPFDSRGARDDSTLAGVRDDLIGAIERTVGRAFRPAFLLSAALAALALLTALAFRRRVVR